MTYLKLLQTSRCLGWFKTGRKKLSCDARVWVLPKRLNNMADIILDRQRDYPADVSHYPVAFISASNSEGTNYVFSLPFSVLFNFFPQEQISVLHIVSPP